jgi:hypothetical protein
VIHFQGQVATGIPIDHQNITGGFAMAKHWKTFFASNFYQEVRRFQQFRIVD